MADRYRLTGDVLDGQMDLDIFNVRQEDSGPYCCRVDIDGIFNDKKVIMNLRVVKGEKPPELVDKYFHRRLKGNSRFSTDSIALHCGYSMQTSHGELLSMFPAAGAPLSDILVEAFYTHFNTFGSLL